MENNELILEEEINKSCEKINLVIQEIHKKVIGQDKLIRNLIIGVLSKGHILLEGVPGLAKTLTVDSLAHTLDLDFKRIQFTPDLLPSDLIGTEIYNMKNGEFSTKKGPIFTNFLLADEINRAPCKVQSALLEAMAEKQVTIGKETFKLNEPFLVLATQNPVEQSGVYKLPEAQLDRFSIKTVVNYPTKEQEIEMYKNLNNIKNEQLKKILSKKELIEIQNLTDKIYVSDNILKYVSDIVDASRNLEKYSLNEIKNYLSYGISPRGGIALITSAKALALLNKRTFVIPEDIKEIAIDTLSHRLILTYEAIANNITQECLINKILDNIKIS